MEYYKKLSGVSPRTRRATRKTPKKDYKITGAEYSSTAKEQITKDEIV
jgi:hypothetical protein